MSPFFIKHPIIAGVIADVLQACHPAKGDDGNLSKAKYVLDDGVKSKASSAVTDLLSKFVLYPELDLPFLKENF